MLPFGTSAWLAIGPALIAGSIGMASALLSFLTTRHSLETNQANARESREHERDLLIWERRLVAAETVWQTLFHLESGDELTERALDTLVRAVVWLPDNTRQEVLAIVAALRAGDVKRGQQHIGRARVALLSLADTTTADRWKELV